MSHENESPQFTPTRGSPMKENYWFYERGEGDPDPRPLTLKSLMTPSPATLLVSQLVRDAMDLMTKKNIHHIPVLGKDGRLAGVVTRHDLLAKILHGHTLTGDEQYHATLDTMLPLEQVMTPRPHVLAPDDPVAKGVALFLTHGVHCVPVMDGSSLVGIVTEKDIFRLMEHMVS
ncbi:MAG: CBS domain-containing protein [Deltaproteobacteria bacterium]|nr:CBS domain-containing protein [Deltaproteobacteria bacterium]